MRVRGFFVIHLVVAAGMGFGDVRLSFLLGLYLGYLGGLEWCSALFLGFLYGAVIGVLLMATGMRGRKPAHPVRAVPGRGRDHDRARRRADPRLVPRPRQA